jgi:hypothetical protein
MSSEACFASFRVSRAKRDPDAAARAARAYERRRIVEIIKAVPVPGRDMRAVVERILLAIGA